MSNVYEEFLNECDEIHSFWYGFTDAISWSRRPGDAPECLNEPHYYNLGYFVGSLFQAGFWVTVGALTAKVIMLL